MIGNYIRDIWSDNGFFKVTEIRKDKVFYGNCFKAKFKDIRPIPLTEDILLKAGFEKKDNDYPTDFIEWCEKEFPVIGVLCQSSDKTYLFDEETDTLRIHYLHQLQNLFKSLTGNDLKIEV